MSGDDRQVSRRAAMPGRPAHEALPPLRWVLGRHGAAVRRLPDQAEREYSTIYRRAVLQIPEDDLARRPSLIRELNRVLEGTGHRLTESDGRRPRGERFTKHAHRRVRLDPTQDGDADFVDAWEALQALRDFAWTNDTDEGLCDVVRRIELEHLLFGATVVPPDTSTEGHPATVSFPWPGSGGHSPVTLDGMTPSARSPLSEIPGGRRPLIAVLDTGVGRHPWLREEPGHSNGDGGEGVWDPFVVDDDELQELIEIGEVRNGADYGHGTFIAGILRQACPDARVLNIRVMHDDGVVRENDLLLALAGVLARNRAVQADFAAGREPDASKFVDVVSLSAGYYPENADAAYTTRLFFLVEELSASGVLIVASAGNDSTDVPCYPAGMPVVLSVGALDPDGKRAPFSNFGPWVKCWARGAAVISTMPMGNAAADPLEALMATTEQPPLDPRPDGSPDEYDSGAALWSGTSFAAPLVAAELARALIVAAAANGDLSMDRLGVEHTLERARAASISLRARQAASA